MPGRTAILLRCALVLGAVAAPRPADVLHAEALHTDTLHAGTLHVFAAASLTEAFTELGAAFAAGRDGVAVDLHFAGSQVLRTQIEQGARADVFASADLDHARALGEAGLLGPVTVFARTGLVIVVPVPAEDARVAALDDLARPGTKIVVAGPAVPAGRYTEAALGKLASALGARFADAVRANVVSRETSVRAVLAKVVLGEADAGFVYRTDALAAGARVGTVAIPDSLNVAAAYPAGVVAGSDVPDLARAFVAFLTGPEAQAVLSAHGFSR